MHRDKVIIEIQKYGDYTDIQICMYIHIEIRG